MMIPKVTDRLVFGALALRPGGSGVQTYQRELIRALSRLEQLPDLAAVVQEDAVGELPEGVAALTQPTSSGARRALRGLLPVRGALLFHGLDVDLPVAQRCPTVTTVHDMSVFDTPWAMSKVRARGEQLLLRRSIRRADEVISVSRFTAERVKALTGRESTVVPLEEFHLDVVPSGEDLPEGGVDGTVPTDIFIDEEKTGRTRAGTGAHEPRPFRGRCFRRGSREPGLWSLKTRVMLCDHPHY